MSVRQYSNKTCEFPGEVVFTTFYRIDVTDMAQYVAAGSNQRFGKCTVSICKVNVTSALNMEVLS